MDSLVSTVTPAVNVVFDAAGSALDVAADCVQEGGRVVTVSPMAPLTRDLDAKKVTLVRVQGYYASPDVMPFKRDDVAAYLATPEHTKFGRLIIEHLPRMLEEGQVQGNRYEVLEGGIEGILGGLERLQKGSVSGLKLVAHPHD